MSKYNSAIIPGNSLIALPVKVCSHSPMAIIILKFFHHKLIIPYLEICTWSYAVHINFCEVFFFNHLVCFWNSFIFYVSNMFLFIAKWYFMKWINHLLFTHSPVDGHLSYFQIFTIVNKVANTSLYNNFCEHIFSFILSKYGGIYYCARG